MIPVVAIVGPTASGKSELAIALAKETGGEVVNADSMQLYQGMNIGTAKLAAQCRDGVVHHLLDVWPVTKAATLAEYQRLALGVIDQTRANGVVPIVVGGSGMYVHAVVDRWQIPGTDPHLREELNAELEAIGSKALHERLEALDPAAAHAILPSNGRRIVRALEVVSLQGTFHAELPRDLDGTGRALIGLDVPADVLDERIKRRVDRMWDSGLVAEVEGLAEQGLRQGTTACRALGYAQVLAQIDGLITREQAMGQTIAATKRFARRQQSWFRRDPRVQWMDYDAPGLVAAAVAACAAAQHD